MDNFPCHKSTWVVGRWCFSGNANAKLCQDSGTGECEGKTERNSNKFYCPSDDDDGGGGVGAEHSITSPGRSPGVLLYIVDSCSEGKIDF